MERGLASCITTTIAFALVAHIQVKSQQPSDDAAWQQYQHILRASTLEWLPSEPFLLKVEYQLYDLDGKPSMKGAAEESWTEAGGKQVRIQSPSLVIGDSPSADEYSIHTRESYLVHQAINALSRPFDSPIEHKDFAVDEFKQTISGSERGCFSFVRAGTTRAQNAFAYCTDADNHIVLMTGPLFVLERSDFRKYSNHEIPTNLALSYEGKPALTMHVTELDPVLDHPVGNSKVESSVAFAELPPEVVSRSLLKEKVPKYPFVAKMKHIQGSVLITAIITKQGTIAGMDVIASPDKILTQAARDAVQNWTYRPYLLNGLPTEVETTITVNFAFGK
jgi:TonB family protein